MLLDEEIAKIVFSSKKPKEICAKLVEAANQAGGKDNITIIAISVKREAKKPRK